MGFNPDNLRFIVGGMHKLSIIPNGESAGQCWCIEYLPHAVHGGTQLLRLRNKEDVRPALDAVFSVGGTQVQLWFDSNGKHLCKLPMIDYVT